MNENVPLLTVTSFWYRRRLPCDGVGKPLPCSARARQPGRGSFGLFHEQCPQFLLFSGQCRNESRSKIHLSIRILYCGSSNFKTLSRCRIAALAARKIQTLKNLSFSTSTYTSSTTTLLNVPVFRIRFRHGRRSSSCQGA